MEASPLRFSPLAPRFLIALGAVGMWWSGLRLHNEALLFWGYLWAVIWVVAWLVSRGVERGLGATRHHPARVFEGETARVILEIDNRGRLPLIGLEIEDQFRRARASV